jgi:AcrR family transcriptional regulator
MPVTTFDDLKEKGRETRREFILEAALKLFSERGFLSVTVREIAKEAGVSPGTIYRYYENIDDLFLDLFFKWAKEELDIIEAERRSKNGCSVKRLCEIHVGYLNDNISFYQMMSHFMTGGGTLSAEATEKLNPMMRDFMDIIEEIVKEAGLTGDTRLISHTLFSALNGIMISYARYPGRSLDEIRRHTMRLAGVVADQFESGAKEDK